MKKLYIIYLLPIMFSDCVEDVVMPEKDTDEPEISTRSSGQEGDLFDYYFGEKIYLTQRTDQVFLKFSPDATEEQFRAVVKNNTISQKVNANRDARFTKGYKFNTLTLEIPQSADAFRSFKEKEEIVSAS